MWSQLEKIDVLKRTKKNWTEVKSLTTYSKLVAIRLSCSDWIVLFNGFWTNWFHSRDNWLLTWFDRAVSMISSQIDLISF